MTLVLGGLEVGAGFVGGGQRVAPDVEGPPRQHVEVGPHLDAVRQRALLPNRPELLGLGRRRQEDGRVVSENAGQDLEGQA